MTIAEIRKFAQTTQKFVEAENLFEHGNVVLPKKYLNKARGMAEVLYNSQVIKVSFTAKDGELTCKCSCLANVDNCVHIVAVLLKYHQMLVESKRSFNLAEAFHLDCDQAEMLIENLSLEIIAGGWNFKLGFTINLDKHNPQPSVLRFYCCDATFVYFLHLENDTLHSVELSKFKPEERATLLFFDKLCKQFTVGYDRNSLLFPLAGFLKELQANTEPTIFVFNDDKIDNILFLRISKKHHGLNHVCGFSGKKVFDFVTYKQKEKQIVLRSAYLSKFTDFKFPYTINIYKLQFGEPLFFHFLIQLKRDGFKNFYFQSEDSIVKEKEYLPKLYFKVEYDPVKNKFVSDAFFKYKNHFNKGTTTVYPHRYYMAKKSDRGGFNRLLFYEEAVENFYQDQFDLGYFRKFEHLPIQDKNQIEAFKAALDDLMPVDLAEVSLSDNLLHQKPLHFALSDLEAVAVDDKQIKLSFAPSAVELKLIKRILSAYHKGNVVCIDQESWYDLKQPAAKELIQFWNQFDLRNATSDGNHIYLPKYYLFEVAKIFSQYLDIKNLFDVPTIKKIEDQNNNVFDLSLEHKKITSLRNYQQEGVKWIRGLEENKFGGILADEMGLGKTVQVIFALLDSYLKNHVNLPSLIIVPASLLLNWKSEFEKFAPQIKVKVANIPSKERGELYEKLTNEILIVSFNVLRSDVKLITKQRFHYVVIDEAQGIKNDSSSITKAAKKVKGNFCLALTGTPIENRLLDLWSCFDFVLPSFLGNKKQFTDQFEKEKTDQSFHLLMQRTSPFILRRTKSKVLKELPNKITTDIYVELNPMHQKLYEEERDRGLEEIKQIQDKSSFNILILILKLRHLCSLPKNSQGILENSAKKEAALEIIHEAIENQRKIILFTQFIDVIDHFKDTFKEQGIEYFIFDGRKSPKSRHSIIEKFNNAKNPCVLLASLKAGGVGINLTAAEVVIHFDVWWNTAVENQATDRAHRIGQKKTVQVYRIIAKNTIEERVCQVQAEKQELVSKTLVEDVNFFESLTNEELLRLFE